LVKGLAVIKRDGEVIFYDAIDDYLLSENFKNILVKKVMEGYQESLKEFQKDSIDGYYMYTSAINSNIAVFLLDTDRIGSWAYVKFLHEKMVQLLEKCDLTKHKDLKFFRKSLENMLKVKQPRLKDLLDLLKHVIKALSEESLMKFALSLYSSRARQREKEARILSPYKVVNYEDGVKRAIAAAFFGDLIEAFKLALGALQYKWDNLTALFAAYVGLQLREMSPDYPAPSLKLIRSLLRKIKPKTTCEELLKGYLELLLKSQTSYRAFLEAKEYLYKRINEIFDIFRNTKEVFHSDILAYILSTTDPSVLSRHKIIYIHDYVGNRSMILGAYLKSALARLRTISMISAKELYIKDALGYVRLVRSRYLNARVELDEVIKKEVEYLDRQTREIMISYIYALTDYLRSVYYTFTVEDVDFDDITMFIYEAVRESIEGLRIIIERLPPVSLDIMFEAIEFLGLILLFSLPYIPASEIETYSRGLLNIMGTFYYALRENILSDRLGAWWVTRFPVLLWLSAAFSNKINDPQPYIISLSRDVIQLIKRYESDILKTSYESYALTLMSLIVAIMYLVSFVPENIKVKVGEKMAEKIEKIILWLLSNTIFQVPLWISFIDSFLNFTQQVSFRMSEKLRRTMEVLASGVLKEKIGELRKKILIDLLGNVKR